jgi:hypothetical protein
MMRKVKGGMGWKIWVEDDQERGRPYLNSPSVRTERSCSTNQMPIRSSGSVRRNAEAARLPMRFRVNMPVGCVWLMFPLP